MLTQALSIVSIITFSFSSTALPSWLMSIQLIFLSITFNSAVCHPFFSKSQSASFPKVNHFSPSLNKTIELSSFVFLSSLSPLNSLCKALSSPASLIVCIKPATSASSLLFRFLAYFFIFMMTFSTLTPFWSITTSVLSHFFKPSMSFTCLSFSKAASWFLSAANKSIEFSTLIISLINLYLSVMAEEFRKCL